MEDLVRASLGAPDESKKAALDLLLGLINPKDLEPYLSLNDLSALLSTPARTLRRAGVHKHCAYNLGAVKRYKYREVVRYLKANGKERAA